VSNVTARGAGCKFFWEKVGRKGRSDRRPAPVRRIGARRRVGFAFDGAGMRRMQWIVRIGILEGFMIAGGNRNRELAPLLESRAEVIIDRTDDDSLWEDE
jgi:hypothetical protein